MKGKTMNSLDENIFLICEQAKSANHRIIIILINRILLCSSNEKIKRVKMKATAWKKTFTIHISNNGIVSRIYEIYAQIIMKKTIDKWTKAWALLKRRYTNGQI